MTASTLVTTAMVLAAAPALPGIATRTRSFLTGRRGPPVLQLYFELAKLARKQVVISAATTTIFRAAPVLAAAATVLAALLLPFDGHAPIAGFAGDFLLFAGLLGVGRFLVILAALDTGSSFEGMGASRDAAIGAFVEGGLLLAFVALVLATGRTSLGEMLGVPLAAAWAGASPSLVMLAVSLFVLLLAEAGRVPVDDPATHLELTMIHEVAILDHSGIDLALLLYGSSLRFALFATLAAGVAVPRASLGAAAASAVLLGELIVIAAAVGVIESVMARLRLTRVPQLLVAASALAAFATVLLLARP